MRIACSCIYLRRCKVAALTSLCCELGYAEEYRRLLAQSCLIDQTTLSNSTNSNSLHAARAGMNLTNVLLDLGCISESHEAQLAFVKCAARAFV